MELSNLDKSWYLIKNRSHAVTLDESVLEVLLSVKQDPDKMYQSDQVWFNVQTKKFLYGTSEHASGAV